MKEARLEFNDGSKVFFTSDTHFWHENILKYCKRPFKSAEEMNEAIIQNWNAVVPDDGTVFHLGDFGFCGSEQLKQILDRLNGTIYLVIGNHDWKMLKEGSSKRFAMIAQQLYIRVEDQSIYLNHYPFLCFAGTYGKENGHARTWQLFGHVHSGPRDNSGLDHQRLINLFPTQYDVGVDNNSFTPISFNKVKEIINEQMLSLNMYRGTN